MQIIILWKIWNYQGTLVSATQVHTAISQWPWVEMWAKSLAELNTKYILEVLTVFQFMPTLYRDHEKFGKSTTIFTETFIRTLAILRVDKYFCFSVLFNNCFPFSIKKPLKYNTVQLVVNKVPKFPWFCKHFKDGFMKTSTAEI